MGRWGCKMTKFFREYNMIIVPLSSFLHPIMVIQSYITHRDKILKNQESWILIWIRILTSRQAGLATFATSIVDNLCSLQQYKWITIKIRLPRLITNAPYGSNFMTILDSFIGCWKNWPLSRGNKEFKQRRRRRLWNRHFNSSDVGNIFWSWILEDCIKVQEKKRKVVVLCSRPRQNRLI